MNIFTFVDTHGMNLKYSAKADLFICCGDFTNFGADQKKYLKQMNKLGKVLLVHGNHESITSLKKDCIGLKNIIIIHNNPVEINGVVFIGWGGGGFSHNDERFEKKDWSKYKGKKLFLVTHAPPYNTCLDEIHGENVGSKSFVKFIKKHNPLYMVCGHIEENEYKECLIAKTKCINPGHEGKLIQIS